MISYLTGCLQTVFKELEQVCLEISESASDMDDQYNDIKVCGNGN